MRSSKELGVVDTIYEEDDYEYSLSSSPSLSNSLSSPPTPLHSRVQSWSLATGRETDVQIYVQGTCFHLHKDPLSARSSYLKRQLTQLSEITLPLNITAETFALVADFCYGNHLVITPFNVAVLRTAAELLGMTETKGRRDENLKQVTESYFRRFVAVKGEPTMIVFRSCLRLLPEAETTVFLLSRCIEGLNLAEDGEELDSCLDDIINLAAEEFQIVVDALQCALPNHDLLYKIISLYIQEHSGKMTEEQKAESCSFIDCDKLSPHLLVHAVQNPSLPLRFIVQAMLMEQLNTRRAILNSANHHHSRRNYDAVDTLGSILRRDAAAREALQLKEEMESTNSRIESLEKELAGMRKLLEESEKEKSLMEKKMLEKTRKPEKDEVEMKKVEKMLEKEERSVMESSRSASFHFESSKEIGKMVERGERGSSSFTGARSSFGKDNNGVSNSWSNSIASPRSKKWGLISRIKSTLWASKYTIAQRVKKMEVEY